VRCVRCVVKSTSGGSAELLVPLRDDAGGHLAELRVDHGEDDGRHHKAAAEDEQHHQHDAKHWNDIYGDMPRTCGKYILIWRS